MDTEQEISNALRLKSRMQAIIQQGYQLMEDMQAQPTDAYTTTLAYVWDADALAEMPTSLGIIQQALADIQTQCPNLSAVIFPQQQEEEGK